jgi:hypothetical protein
MADNTRSVSKRLRYEVLKRDGHRCRYCGAAAPDAALTVDHVIPVALGGDSTAANLATACRDCNAGKSSTSPDEPKVEEVNQLAERLRDALRRVTELDREISEQVFFQADDLVCDFAAEWNSLSRETGRRHPLPESARGSIIRFHRHGLDATDMYRMAYEMFHMAPAHVDGWRYFCKMCWNLIGRRTEQAMLLIESEMMQ